MNEFGVLRPRAAFVATRATTAMEEVDVFGAGAQRQRRCVSVRQLGHDAPRLNAAPLQGQESSSGTIRHLS